MTDVLAIDLATRCGWARGIVGGVPSSGSVDFAKNVSSSSNATFARALTWFSEFLEPKPRPDVIYIERMLSPMAKVGFTTADTRDRLAGLHGIARAVAYLRGIYDIEVADVQDVRGHFINERKLKRHIAKRETVEKCRALGWPCEGDDAADALALWSYACGRIDPQTALQVSPLFNKKLRSA